MQYEIEIKSLLKDKESADKLIKQLEQLDNNFVLLRREEQLNHYFKSGDIVNLISSIRSYLSKADVNLLNDIRNEATSISIRTRQKNGVTIIVVKGSLDKTDAAHSHRRMEFEKELSVNIESLDSILINAGFNIEAKWSATRKIYKFLDSTVDVMFSPGYGYVVEIEKVIHDKDSIDVARKDIKKLMGKLGLKELPSERLARMYAYYNKHWQEYYGTKNIFTIV